MTNSSQKLLIKERIHSLQKSLKEGAFVFEDYFDLYYLTGLKLSRGTLLVSKTQACLFVDGRYLQIAKERFPFKCDKSEPELMEKALSSAKIKAVYFDAEKTSYKQFLYLKKLAKGASASCKEGDNPAGRLRIIKTKQEIKALQKSSDLLMKSVAYAKTKLKPGVTEIEVAKAFEIYALKYGAEKLSFETIVAFGANSAMPHHRSGTKKLKVTDCVLIDAGLMVDNYASDMTRFFFQKNTNKEMKKIYAIVREIHNEVLQMIKPGVKVKSLDDLATKITKKHGYKTVHALGHGVGLEVHESPRISVSAKDAHVLEENMVITIEPGIYVPSLGGVRYEDMVLVTKNGYKNFYK
ncbi:MAG: Methionine aminopeptidase 1, mitochondrial [Chlamydiia bacterium]|nr:Methionine aminopeptidase 1, mitochondrial [Chlamydiia bacterium]